MNEHEEKAQQLLQNIRSLHWKINTLLVLMLCLGMICYIIIYGLKARYTSFPPH